MDYEVMSDQEWEEEPEGESLSVSHPPERLSLQLHGHNMKPVYLSSRLRMSCRERTGMP